MVPDQHRLAVDVCKSAHFLSVIHAYVTLKIKAITSGRRQPTQLQHISRFRTDRKLQRNIKVDKNKNNLRRTACKDFKYHCSPHSVFCVVSEGYRLGGGSDIPT